MDKVLMHTCCAPCSVSCIHQLRSEGIEPTSIWYNPNIHPYMEYKSRRDTLMNYAPSIGMSLIVLENYGLKDFCRAVVDDIEGRCVKCYEMRLDTIAEYAKANGFEAFTTTLLVSPYQKHELIAEVGETVAKRHGVQFLYRDFRPGFRDGQAEARELGMYMQKYCGCVFSEEDRYASKITKDLKQPIKIL